MIDTWLLFVIIGQFIFAAVVLVDRFIVTKKVVAKPVVYAFYVCYLSIFAIGVLPFGVTLISWQMMLVSLVAASVYLLSIYLLYESLAKSNPSEVVPVIGGVAAISAFIGSSLILKDQLPGHFLIGFVILVAGMLLISHFKFTLRSFIFLTSSGVAFGLSTVLVKLIFENENFLNGFFWTRMANVVIAMFILSIPGVLRSVKADNVKGKRKRKALFVVSNKVMAGLASVCVLVAINYGNVSMVNALAAAQYVFLLIFAIFFSRLLPEYFSETVHKHEFLHKSLATALIVVGFFVLFL